MHHECVNCVNCVNICRPFTKEPDFGVTSVNYNFSELMERAEFTVAVKPRLAYGTSFFTNKPGYTLLDRFKMTPKHVQCFDVLVGYFRFLS